MTQRKKEKKMEDDLKKRKEKRERQTKKYEDKPINQNQPNWL